MLQHRERPQGSPGDPEEEPELELRGHGPQVSPGCVLAVRPPYNLCICKLGECVTVRGE